MCACALGPQRSIVGCGHCRQQSESSSILPFALCSAIAHRWLLSSALWCVLAGAPPQPAGIWEAASRIYTHKSDRCMVCHYLPLIIILPLLFIPWATLAIFPAPAQEHLYRGLAGWHMLLRRNRAIGATRALCLCAGLESGNLTFCVLVYALSAMCVYHLGHFAFTQISCKDTKMFSFSWNSWSLTKSLRDCPNLTPNPYPNHRFHSKYFHGWSL